MLPGIGIPAIYSAHGFGDFNMDGLIPPDDSKNRRFCSAADLGDHPDFCTVDWVYLLPDERDLRGS